MFTKRGQVTIFIIIAILIVVAVGAIYYFKDSFSSTQIPANIQPVYSTFLSCLEDYTLVGVDVLESQAGYINLPEFDPGSAYMPFSSQLDFLGNPVPYWYYVSGNNIQKEQVPSKSDMEEDLEGYIEANIKKCYLETYYQDGFEIIQGEPKSSVSIEEREIVVGLLMNLEISKNDDTAIVSSHKINVPSNLGVLYNSARKIYNHEQETLFLENYAVDNLRLYAPVEGVEMDCSPLIWKIDDVFNNLEEAIESNTLALRISDKKDKRYFVTELDIEGDVQFLNSKNWAHGFEVSPAKESLLIAEPIGNQPGLGILGFCYIPYHFVYNVRYPVLVQIQEDEEIFQFPIAVVIQGNMPREAMPGTSVDLDFPEICEYKNTQVTINTYDTSLNSIDSEIEFECAGVRCDIGETQSGFLETLFPQCANGYVTAKSEGFEKSRYLLSTIESGSVDIILDKLYELEIDLKLDNKNYNGEAIITFTSDENSKTVVYPSQKTVELSEGQYTIQTTIYKNSSLKIAATTTQQCVDVPKGNLGSLFGLTEEECFQIEMPEQIISNALSGGGKQSYYILESELSGANKIEINAGSLPSPKSIEQLQDNYIIFEEKGLEIYFI